MSIEFTALDPVLEHVSARLGESRQCIQPEIPHLLFHYTNARGMLGILDTSRLYATNYRFLNDSSEVAYGASIFDGVVKERLEQIDNEVVAIFLKRTLVTANAFEGMFDSYVTCFCERDDLLNQWRVYASTGGGFALGLDARKIGKWWEPLQPQLNQDFFLRKVIYGEALQRKLIVEVVDSTIEALENATRGISVGDAGNLIARCCQFVREQTAEYLMCFKHPAFAVEQEWRLCHVTGPGEAGHLLFRDGPYGLTPYVALDIGGPYENQLPLKRVTLGPAVNPANVRYALEKMLKAKNYAFTMIAGSSLPVRFGL